MATKKPFHETVAENLIEQLKAGTAPWQKPWEAGEQGFLPINPTSGNRYKGINSIHLMSQGYSDNRWLTYKQANTMDAQVKKGEKGTQVQYWKFSEERNKKDENGKPVFNAKGEAVKEVTMLERPRVFLATVFNGELIDNMPVQEVKELKWDSSERAEKILKASGANIRHDENDRAFYRPSTDSIHLPSKESFDSADKYYSTALHELGHMTGHPSRLDRDMSHPFGSEGYAKEELKAECFSLMMGDELGIGHDPEQHAAYVGSWIKVLESDPLEIFRATSDSEKMLKYVLDLELQLEQKNETKKSLSIEQKEGGNIVLDNKSEIDRNLAAKIPNENQVLDQASNKKKYIDVAFKDKDEAKERGAKWDRFKTSWYIPSGVNQELFSKWTGESEITKPVVKEPKLSDLKVDADQERIFLAVPFEKKEEAKEAGAKWDKTVKSWYADSNSNMEKLNKWLPDNVDSEQSPPMPPREEFSQALKNMGFELNGDHPIMDGKTHRTQIEGDKPGEKSGFYVGHEDGHPAGYISNNRTGEELKWKAKGYSLNPIEKAKLNAEAAIKLEKRERDKSATQEETSQRIIKSSEKLVPVTKQTAYMKSKGIKAYSGVLTDKEHKTTYIPVMDKEGKQWSMQYIQEDGTKRFAKNSRKEGCFHVVGGDINSLKEVPAIVVQEGYATAATSTDILGFPTVAAFDSGNLSHVVKALSEKFPDKPFLILGDNDKAQELTFGKNPDKDKAQKAAATVNGAAVFPIFSPTESIYPKSLPVFTVDQYKEHLKAAKELPIAPIERQGEIKKRMLSNEQLAGLSEMKKFTDFNDLANISSLGKEGVERQIKFNLNKIVAEFKGGHDVSDNIKTSQTHKTAKHK